MRENMGLFKAKRTDNKEWVEGYLVKREVPPVGVVERGFDFDKYRKDSEEWYIFYSGFSDWNMPPPLQYVRVDPETVCECTGLQTKAKLPIFENDKLGGIYEQLFIRWCDECKGFALAAIDDPEYCYQCEGDSNWFELVEDEELEIIGNVYDNPDLCNTHDQ